MNNKLNPEQQLAVVLSIQDTLDKLWDKNDVEAYDPFYKAAMNTLITLENAIRVDTNPEDDEPEE